VRCIGGLVEANHGGIETVRYTPASDFVCITRLAAHKAPSCLLILDELRRNALGKVIKLERLRLLERLQ
jgi:hypothetical protein